MSANKNVLIVTDGQKSIDLIAKSIKKELTGCDTGLNNADKFSGTTLLAAETFFLGCEKPNPDSFAYLGEMLSHINLASRKCGIFSTNEESLDYLRSLVKDCEAACGEPLLVTDDKVDASVIKNWVNSILKQ